MGYNPETGMYTPDTPTAPKLSGVGQYETVDPAFVRNAFAEAQAIKDLGLTKAEIEARGGVSASGYYGDSWSAQANLTDAEYSKAISDAKSKGLTGTAIGEAINAATDAKRVKSGLPTLLGDSTTGTGTGTGTGTSGMGTPEQKAAVDAYIEATAKRSERERMADIKTISGVFTGAYAEHPFTAAPIPVWIGDYVLAGYGTGAVMAVPCGDERDYAFANFFKGQNGMPEIKNIFNRCNIL